jgi:hypothetical protein
LMQKIINFDLFSARLIVLMEGRCHPTPLGKAITSNGESSEGEPGSFTREFSPNRHLLCCPDVYQEVMLLEDDQTLPFGLRTPVLVSGPKFSPFRVIAPEDCIEICCVVVLKFRVTGLP